MILGTLHTISGCLIIVALIAKIVLHYYLLQLHNENSKNINFF